MQWSGHLRGAIAVPVLALLIGGTTVSAEQPGVPPGGGHGPAMRQGGYHEPGLVRRDLADRIAHVGRMLNEVAPILIWTRRSGCKRSCRRSRRPHRSDEPAI